MMLPLFTSRQVISTFAEATLNSTQFFQRLYLCRPHAVGNRLVGSTLGLFSEGRQLSCRRSLCCDESLRFRRSSPESAGWALMHQASVVCSEVTPSPPRGHRQAVEGLMETWRPCMAFFDRGCLHVTVCVG